MEANKSSRQSPPPFPQSGVSMHREPAVKSKSRKPLLWIGIGALIVIIGIVIAVVVSKTPDDDVEINNEDPVRAMLSEDEWNEAEAYVQPSAIAY